MLKDFSVNGKNYFTTKQTKKALWICVIKPSPPPHSPSTQCWGENITLAHYCFPDWIKRNLFTRKINKTDIQEWKQITMEKNSKLETKFTNFCEAAKGNPFKWIETVQQVGSNWYWMESRERERERWRECKVAVTLLSIQCWNIEIKVFSKHYKLINSNASMWNFCNSAKSLTRAFFFCVDIRQKVINCERRAAFQSKLTFGKFHSEWKIVVEIFKLELLMQWTSYFSITLSFPLNLNRFHAKSIWKRKKPFFIGFVMIN